jgi:hypothetical protein
LEKLAKEEQSSLFLRSICDEEKKSLITSAIRSDSTETSADVNDVKNDVHVDDDDALFDINVDLKKIDIDYSSKSIVERLMEKLPGKNSFKIMAGIHQFV